MTVRARLPLIAAVLVGSGIWAQSLQVEGFPHDRHEGLFPLCQSCHRGIDSGDENAPYPDPDRCANCHDGTRAARVDWTAPSRAPSNLDFSHSEHRRRAGSEGEPTDCAVCHRAPGAVEAMAVVPAAPETCLTCHAHEAREHLSETRDCSACHRPITEALDLPLERLTAFPSPPGHTAPAWIREHAPTVPDVRRVCATCHASESCTRCHLNGERIEAIRTLEGDARVALLEAGRLPFYPTPEDHLGPEWGWRHGAVAATDAEGCANCHARESCLTCHTTAIPSISLQPVRPTGDRRGARLDGEPAVHEVGFTTSHAAGAAADRSMCATCHTDGFCASCHAGSSTPAFHFDNFLQQHGPEAWGNEAECSTCHNTDVFCRSCHEAVGRGAVGRLDVAYHSRRPFWLFGHGTAARQGLESCRGCHSQGDCMICHSAVGSWRVNPHGPGFPADRLRDANIWSCLACHRTGVPR